MSSLGVCSYWYLGHALASSRKLTMERREQRLITSINTWPAKDTSLTLPEKLGQLSPAVSVAATDAIQVYEPNGKLIYSSPEPDSYKIEWPDNSCIEPCYAVVHKDGHTIRTLNHVVFLGGRRVRLSLSGATDEHFQILRIVRDSYLIFCPLLLLGSIAGGWALSYRALEPVHRITSKARTIGIQDLQHRLPVPQTGDELQLLAETWNDLLGRLDIAVKRLTQFTSDISHDLRTTITVMLSTAEVALRRQRSEEQYRTALGTIVAECHATSRLLDDLLAAARADIVKQNIDRETVSIVWMILEARIMGAAVWDSPSQSGSLKHTAQRFKSPQLQAGVALLRLRCRCMLTPPPWMPCIRGRRNFANRRSALINCVFPALPPNVYAPDFHLLG